MWYQFDTQGECVSTSTGEIAPMQGITSVWCDEAYEDLKNLRLVDGKVVHIND